MGGGILLIIPINRFINVVLTFIPSLGTETHQDQQEESEQEGANHHNERFVQVAV